MSKKNKDYLYVVADSDENIQRIEDLENGDYQLMQVFGECPAIFKFISKEAVEKAKKQTQFKSSITGLKWYNKAYG